MALTERQNEILKAIIEEYIYTAQPIASVELVEKRGLNLSGATVRNIMSDLVRKGYLQMLHVSSGRIPSERAYRHYISELMDELDINVLDEVAIRQKVWSARYELERLLRNAAVALSDATNVLGLSLTSDGYITYSGTSKILDLPEFFKIDVARSVFRFVDDYELAKSVLEKAGDPNSVSILIGREIGLANMEPVCLISAHCLLEGKDCFVGLIGPSRIQYGKVIPIVRHMSGLLEEAGESL